MLIATFAFGQRMDFIDDHALQPGKHPWRIGIRQQKRKAFRRRQQDMGRIDPLALALRLGRVACAILSPYGQAHLVYRGSQVAANVRGQGLER